MEKIYMEENKSQQSSKGLTFSVVLSFIVALFAIFSIGSYGILSLQGGSKISYAAPTDDSLTFYHNATAGFVDGKTSSDGGGFSVPLYYSDENGVNPVFCVQHNTGVINGQAYSKGNVIDDAGLLYILNSSFANGKNIAPSAQTNKYVEAWITQVAIWIYLYQTDSSSNNSTSPNHISSEDLDKIAATTKLSYRGDANAAVVDFGESVYTKYVVPLVNEAKAFSQQKRLEVTKDGDSMNKTSDGSYYMSEKISVIGNPSGDLQSYKLEVTGIDGISVVDDDGKEITDLNNISPATSFYIKVPADKVTTTVQTINISVTGTFNMLTGNYYNAVGNDQLQKIVSVTSTTTAVNAGTEIEVVGAPDTGMNTAQTIYFIGLIVLLCGVGIVYANAKPVEIKQ